MDSVPPAPPMFSMMTGCPSVPLMCSTMMRASASTAPPAGNTNTSVIGRDGKVCACALARPASAASATAAISFLMSRLRSAFSSLDLDAGFADNRAPFVHLGFQVRSERLRGLLLGRGNLQALGGDALADRR